MPMSTKPVVPRLCACLVLLLALMGSVAAQTDLSTRADSAAAQAGAITRVLCAVDEHSGAEAHLELQSGLVLSGWPAAGGQPLHLGAAGWPRFADDGRLVFERGSDDGHVLTGHELLVLDPGQLRPRRARPDERLPAWSAPPPPPPGGPIRVAIDAGHGGSDPGASGNGLQEKDVTLDVALRLADLLLADSADTAGGGNWDVLLTRASDATVSLLQRVSLANAFAAQSFCSIHCNAFGDPSANGTETYSHAEGTVSASLRNRVHAQMLSAWGLTDRGTKTAGFYVLVNTSMPAELAEMGFITHPGDAALLGSAAARQQMALAHLFALQQHHGLLPYEPGMGGGTLKGILYNAQLGVGAPIAGGTVALADGRFTLSDGAGFFAFALPAGAVSFAATAPGFAASSASEIVTSGDVWESLGLLPAPGPALTLSSSGANLDLDLTGASPFTSAWLLWSIAPSVPPPSVGAKGKLWPHAATLQLAALGPVGAGGSLHLDLTLPSFPGLFLHAQGHALVAGQPRLGNGAAVPFP